MRHHTSPHLDDLRVVLAVAEEGNFHRAGVKVGLSQTGVTRVVARVERHVRARIFERSHNRYHSVTVTPAGCEYLERISSVIAQSDHADFVARETKNGTTHRILVGKSIYTDKRLVDILRSMDLPLYPGLVVDFATKLPVELPVCVRTGQDPKSLSHGPVYCRAATRASQREKGIGNVEGSRVNAVGAVRAAHSSVAL